MSIVSGEVCRQESGADLEYINLFCPISGWCNMKCIFESTA